MKVYLFPADKTGCGAYRMIWPANALASTGHNVVIGDAEQHLQADIQGGWRRADGKLAGGRMLRAIVPADADVVVLQRPMSRYLADAVPLLREQGVAVVVEMDDDLASIHPRHPMRNQFDPRFNSEYNWEHAERACDAATLVTATTQPLLDRYATVAPGLLIPNYAPDFLLSIPHEDSDQIGWGGAVATHPDDPRVIGNALARLFTTSGRHVRIVGPGPEDQVAPEFGLRPRQVRCTGSLGIGAYAPSVAAHIGIGVAPLQRTVFNLSKSFLKVLEYSALGIPWVASGLDEYRTFYADSGGGLIAESPNQWYQHLRRLTRSRALRLELGAAGRQAVTERFTISGNAWRWWAAWEHAHELQRVSVKVS